METETPEGVTGNEGVMSDELQKGLEAAANAQAETTENDETREPEVEVAETQVVAKVEPAAPSEDWKAKYEERERNLVTESNALAQKAYDDLIRRTAAKNAAAYEALTGEKPPPDMFPAPPKAADPNAKPEDALTAQVAELKAWRADQERQAKQAQEKAAYQAQLSERTEKLYAATEKHKDVYEHPHFGEQMTQLLTNEFLKAAANPKAVLDPQKLADDVAKKFRAAIEWEKAKYVGTKKAAAAQVPAGAGPAGGRQPGQARPEPDLGSRKGRASMAKAMAEFAGAGEDGQ